MNQTPMDWNGNRDRIISAIQSARDQGVQILCLPELAISGYGCEDVFHAPWMWKRSWETLKEILPHTKNIAVGVGLPFSHENHLFNAVAMLVDGQCGGVALKQKLAGDGIHYEPRWFKPWLPGQALHVKTDLGTLPIGDLFFSINGVHVGFEICEDAWVADRPGIRLMRVGVDVILNPSASHFAFGKQEIRSRFVLEGSRAFGCAYVYANLLGNEAGRAIYDGSALIADHGKLIGEAKRFSFSESQLLVREVDIEVNRGVRSRIFSNQPHYGDQGISLPLGVEANFECGNSADAKRVSMKSTSPAELEGWERGTDLKSEEFARAVALGLWDYMRKTRSRGFVVSLSGGADSAAVACLVGIMVRLALDELGEVGFIERLGLESWNSTQNHTDKDRDRNSESAGDPSHISDVTRLTRKWTQRLLTTLYQGTENSSETTRKAAESVANGIGADGFSSEIQEIVEKYHQIVSTTLGRELAWNQDDIAMQNIQARVRSPGVWMIANIKGALLLSTSNRSEAAVGYATMDGDTSGGLSPIAGIDKAFLREWLRWLEVSGLSGLGPFSFLGSVNSQRPTAELRPSTEGQTDEADLMPYPILNRIEALAIRDLHSPSGCLQILIEENLDIDPTQLKAYVIRFFQLWSRNQWKRERYAPSFHLDDRNLDPRTWCRFPILNSGFAQELNELKV